MKEALLQWVLKDRKTSSVMKSRVAKKLHSAQRSTVREQMLISILKPKLVKDFNVRTSSLDFKYN